MQYGLEERREDFTAAFSHVVDAAIELKVSFLILAGDIFDNPRPSSATLTSAISELKRLKERNIPALAVNGSHDTSQTPETSILTPLDKAEILRFLPLYGSEGWSNRDCYVYGLFNYSSRLRWIQELPDFLRENPPRPEKPFNICVLHQGIEWPSISVPYPMEIRPDELPPGFQYYASGHLHHHEILRLKPSGAVFVYPGATETKEVREAEEKKGFCHIQVQSPDEVEIEHEEIPSRRFVRATIDCEGMTPREVTYESVNRVRALDCKGCIVAITLEGSLAPGFKRYQVEVNTILEAKKQALYVQVLSHLKEAHLTEVSRARVHHPRDLHERLLPYLEQLVKETFSTSEGSHMDKNRAHEDAEALWQIVRLAKTAKTNDALTLTLSDKITELTRSAPALA